MKEYNNLLVCLDLTEMDGVLLRYARFLLHTLPKIKKVYFLHNIRFDYPEEAEGLMEELESPLPELIREEITERIEMNFLNGERSDLEWEVLIKEGDSTAHEIVNTAKEQNIELTIFGKKLSYRGSGLVAEKLLRQSSFKSDLLVLPETTSHNLQKILVPIDFSSASKRALETAHYLSLEADTTVVCQHVYTIPNHYFPFIPVQGFRKSMEEEAEQSFKRFRQSLPKALQDIPCQFTYAQDRTRAESIYDFSINRNKDLIVIGSRGRGAVPSVLLGSTAIQILQFEFHIPVLVVR
jgi:nucleotide-binding universal stress UspA family protein